jgi:hypothetical protein
MQLVLITLEIVGPVLAININHLNITNSQNRL